MTADQAMAFALMGGAILLFIWGKLRYDLVAVLALVVGVLVGVIPEDKMFSGFSNDLIWIIAAVLVLSAAIARSGLIERAFNPIIKYLSHPSAQIPIFSGAVMVLSMLFFGGPTLHHFSLALTIGILFGIYSSIFVAAGIALRLGVRREDLVRPGGGRGERDPSDPNAGAVV